MESHRQTDRDRPLPTLRVSPGQTLSDQARNSRDNCDSVGDRTRSRLAHRRWPGPRLVGRGARAVLALVLATAAAYAGGGVPTAWTASYTTVRVDAAPAYRHVLEEDDRLVLVQYSTAEDPEEDETAHGARGIIIQLLVDDAVVIQQTPVISGYGLAAFYWAASEADIDLPWESSSAQVRLAVNPLIDPSPASHTLALTWNDTDGTDETADELADDIKAILASIETNDPDVDQGEYVSPTGVTLAGQSIVAAAFSQLVTLAASAFDFARIAVGEDISYDEVEIGGLAVPQITETFEGVLPPADRYLYPDGPGYKTELSIPSTSPPQDCSVNWECATSYGNDSYLFTGPSRTVGTDAYQLPDITDLPESMPIVWTVVGWRWTAMEGGTTAPGVYLNGTSRTSGPRALGLSPGVWRGNGWIAARPDDQWTISDINDLEVTMTLLGQDVYVAMVRLSVRFVDDSHGAKVDFSRRLKARHYNSDMSGIVVVQQDKQSITDITSKCTLGEDGQTLTCTELTRKTYPSDIEVTYYSATEGEDSPFMTSVAGMFGAFGIPWAAGRVLFVGVVIATLIGCNVTLFRGSTEFLVIAWTGDVLFYAARAGALPWAPVLLILFLVVIAGALGTFKRVTL